MSGYYSLEDYQKPGGFKINMLTIAGALVGCAFVSMGALAVDRTNNLYMPITQQQTTVGPLMGTIQRPVRTPIALQATTQGSLEGAIGAAAIGMAAAGAESQHLLPLPWAATGLSLAFLAVVLYLFGEWRRPGPGFALAGPSPPTDTADEELGLAEMAAKPMAMSTSGSGKVAGEQLITVDKPLGLTLGEKKNGGIEVSFVNPLGNAAKAGIKPGDTVIYHSSFFGDELWPADKLSFVRSAITACPNAVDFIIMRGAAADQVNVKRLPKRPAPPKIGRKLTAAQKERATHICLDCGWIYALPTPFDQQAKDYRCPQCQATKSRFAKYDVETGKVIGGSGLPQGILTTVLGGAALVVILGYIAISL